MKYIHLIFFVQLILANVSAQEFPNPPKPWQEAYNIMVKHLEFSHPMTVVNKAEHAEILQRIKNKTEPQYSAYLKLLKEADASLTFMPKPPASMDIMGGYEKNSNLSKMRTILWESCHAAYSTALAYSYSGDEKYAQKAIQILMAWAQQSTTFTGADRGLQLGSYFNPMLYSADLLHDYKGWAEPDRQKFESWWRKNCLKDGDVLGVMRRKDNNWKDAAILGVITAAVVFEDTLLLKEALIQQTSYFYKRIDKNVRNKGEAWKFSKDKKGEYLLREVVRNDGRSGLTYTAYALTTMVQHFEIASYFGFDFWNKKTPDGASVRGIIQQYYKWDIVNEDFPWHTSPKKTAVRQNIYELANKHFEMGYEFQHWLTNNRPVEGRQGDAFSTLNKGDLYEFSSNDYCTQTNEKREFPSVKELPDFPELQDPFLKPDGKRVQSKSEWENQRTYLKQMLSHYMYGQMPPKPQNFQVEKVYSKLVFNDSIIEEVYHVMLERNGKTARFKTGIRRPNSGGKFPIIIKNDSWIFDINEVQDDRTREKYIELERDKIEDYVAHEAVKRGYVICKFNRNEVSPDNADFKNMGVIPLYPEYDWGTIASWAWAYQILIDYFEKQPYADAEKVTVTGHSRGGKTALCAGVYDERIAITAPSSSGAGGTASWRYFDEEHERQLIEHHTKRFPHWWTPELYSFAGKENKMPFDAHFQKALIAPRGLINVHSREDYWANPYGTYLTFLAGEVVYNWMDANGNQGIHWRNGPHNQNYEDWLAIFEFCDYYFFDKKTNVDFTQNPHSETYHFEGLVTFKLPTKNEK